MHAASQELAPEVRQMIIDALPPDLPGRSDPNPLLFGGGAPLDSLGLVNLLADLEYRLGERFGRDVVLASERAMSRSQSPFRDVSSLTEYIVGLMG